jgi:carbamoyl-phosphate synthase large subunit
MESSEKIRIIRSAIGSMPSWGIINELLHHGVEVIGIDSDPKSFGLYKLKKKYVVPRGDHPDFIDVIKGIVKNEGCNAIISGPEEEIISLSRNRSFFEEMDCTLLMPEYNDAVICADKYETNHFFKENCIPTPVIFTDPESIRYPCLIKPRFGRGGTDVFRINNKNELQFYYNKVKNPIIQELLQGDEYSVDILADRTGNALSIVPRLRMGIDSGISVKGVTIFDREIITFCEQIVKKLRLFGPSCIQCIKTSEGIFFFDINARFGGGSILSIKADPTIIPNLIKIIKDEEPTPSVGFTEGLMMLRYYSEVFIKESDVVT